MWSRPGPAHLHIEAPGPQPLRLALETSRAQGSKTHGRRGTDLQDQTSRPLRPKGPRQTFKTRP